MQRQMRKILVGISLLALGGCMGDSHYLAFDAGEGVSGGSIQNNILVETGQRGYVVDLARRFASDVPNTVNFAFDSDRLDAGAQAVLRRQADWIRHFPEVRFRVFGYTDLVGTESYNKSLGMRRARAVVAYLASQGISTRRLEAVVSYGKTRPLVPVSTPERANRRAITDVSGFVQGNRMVLDGKYADIVYRNYVTSAQPGSSSGSSASGSAGSSAGGTGGDNPTGLSANTLPGN